MLTLLLAALTQAAPLPMPAESTSVPVTRSVTEVPTAVQQKYLSRGIDEALDEFDFERMRGKSVELDVVEMAPSHTLDIPEYLRSAISSRIAMHGGEVVRQGRGDAVMHLRVQQAGLDRVTVHTPKQKKRSQAGAVTLMAIGGTVFLAAQVQAASYTPEAAAIEAIIGLPSAAVAGGGYALYRWNQKHPRQYTTSAREHRMRVTMEATLVPKGRKKGKAWTTRGDADLLVAN